MICPTCGVDAVNPETGACEYCPGHLKNVGGAPAGGDDGVASVLAGSVAQVAAALEGVEEVPLLNAIRDAELAGKARKGVLAAIDARNAALAVVE